MRYNLQLHGQSGKASFEVVVDEHSAWLRQTLTFLSENEDFQRERAVSWWPKVNVERQITGVQQRIKYCIPWA